MPASGRPRRPLDESPQPPLDQGVAPRHPGQSGVSICSRRPEADCRLPWGREHRFPGNYPGVEILSPWLDLTLRSAQGVHRSPSPAFTNLPPRLGPWCPAEVTRAGLMNADPSGEGPTLESADASGSLISTLDQPTLCTDDRHRRVQAGPSSTDRCAWPKARGVETRTLPQPHQGCCKGSRQVGQQVAEPPTWSHPMTRLS
jgi:hypothetical protein